jgi:phosphohistidine phosphatase SixA
MIDFGKAVLFLLLAGPWFEPTCAIAQASASADLPLLTVFVRHADRASQPAGDPGLTEAGAQRAKDLAASLRDTRLTAIITTQYLRVRDTAQPTAAALSLAPEVFAVKNVYDAADQEAHVKDVLAALHKHAGGAVLVVDHGNMIWRIIAALGGPRLPDICDPIYDHMLVVVPIAGKIQLVSSRYGAASPPPSSGCM